MQSYASDTRHWYEQLVNPVSRLLITVMIILIPSHINANSGGSSQTYWRLGPPIISIVLLYHLRSLHTVIRLRHQTLIRATRQSHIPPARDNCNDDSHSVPDCANAAGSTRTYWRLGLPTISIVLLYYPRRLNAVIRIIHQTLVRANSESYIPPARDNCNDNAHSIPD